VTLKRDVKLGIDRGDDPGAPEAKSLEEGHYHAFLDITPDTAPGKPFTKGDRIVHTVETSTTFNNVAPGEHIVTVVLGYSDHLAWQPVVENKVTFNVNDGLGQVAPPRGRPTVAGSCWPSSAVWRSSLAAWCCGDAHRSANAGNSALHNANKRKGMDLHASIPQGQVKVWLGEHR
jgi:hypothetical protein